jgi:ABC-type glycerol-3-phosphate transport system permease component
MDLNFTTQNVTMVSGCAPEFFGDAYLFGILMMVIGILIGAMIGYGLAKHFRG